MAKRENRRILSRGVRKHIRRIKAKIRRNEPDPTARNHLIAELYGRFHGGR